MATATPSKEEVTAKPIKKPPREDVAPGEILCKYCTAKCCRYFALPLETPDSFSDYEYIRWYLLHDRATAFIEDGTWYLLVHTRCKHLGGDNLCRSYATRPKICRDYSTKDCEYEDDWVYEHYFETSEQVAEYVEALMAFRKGAQIRSPRPEPLTVL
jgi:Fe-S-cluster containining protein